MKLIVGLGNPGRRYAATRHNVGVRVLERFAERQRIALDATRFEGRFGRGRVKREDVGLLAPETFMNHSGRSVAAALRALPVDDAAHDLLLVYDDVDLPFGRLRVRGAGSAGGHNGIADVLERSGRRDLPRLRFGVGRSAHAGVPTDAWVLQRFSPDEERDLPSHLERAAAAVESFVLQGLESTMNEFNGAG